MNDKKKSREPVVALDPVAFRLMKEAEAEEVKAAKGLKKTDPAAAEAATPEIGVLGQIVKSLQQHSRSQVERMAFEIDPKANYNGVSGYYRLKQGLTPDAIIKKIIGPQGDDLVCQVLQARANIISAFGRPRTGRFAMGFEFEAIEKNAAENDEKKKEAIKDRIEQAKKRLWTCGGGDLDDEIEQPTLAQFFKLITRDGVGFGRFAVERLWQADPKTGQKYLYAFRASDAGTVYKLLPQRKTDQSIRAQALRELQRLKGEKFDTERYKKDEYKWVQVIDAKPVQAFTAEEMVVYNLYPVTNVEYNGYPLTPIDQALNAITTHINITIHNKLYFQNGRAARGMLVFKSDSIDEGAVQKIRLQFHQSINSVQNAWRMPVFAVGAEDDVRWESIDISGRDAEFQYLMDNNARVILSAFQMSPEELPGYAHLARGTNTQALSESDNEWKLTAARDVGLRPLMHDIQDFMNKHILPFIDPELAKTHRLVLSGLDKDSPEKESTRLQQDMNVHMTYNEIHEQVEKDPLKREMAAEIPLNPQYQMQLDKYVTVGEIMAYFMDKKDAATDPRYQYIRDPFWFQYQQLLLQKAQLALQEQMAAQQQAMQVSSGGPGDEGSGEDQEDEGNDQSGEQGGDSGDENPPPEQSGKPQEISQKNSDWAFKNFMVLSKSIKHNHTLISQEILRRQKQIVKAHMDKWAKEAKTTAKDLESIIHEHADDDNEE